MSTSPSQVDFGRYAEEIEQLLVSVKSTHPTNSTLPTKTPSSRDLHTIESNLDLYKIQIELIEIDATHHKERRPLVRENRALYKDFSKRLNELKLDQKRMELMGERDVDEHKVEPMKEMQALEDHGRNVMQASKESLQRTLGQIEDAKRIGRTTNAKLEDQTDQIVEIHDHVEEIETILDRAKHILTRIGRRIASDRYIQGVLVLIAIAIILVLLVHYSVI